MHSTRASCMDKLEDSLMSSLTTDWPSVAFENRGALCHCHYALCYNEFFSDWGPRLVQAIHSGWFTSCALLSECDACLG